MKGFVSLGIMIALCSLMIFCSKNASQSELLYNQHCGSCHLANGEGVGDLIPSLLDSELFFTDRDSLVCLIRYGISNSTGNETESYVMPGNTDLSSTEITNILNYIRAQWHPEIDAFSIQEIEKSKATCN